MWYTYIKTRSTVHKGMFVHVHIHVHNYSYAITIGQCSKICWKFQVCCQEPALQQVAHAYFVSLDAIEILSVGIRPSGEVSCSAQWFLSSSEPDPSCSERHHDTGHL